MDFFFCVRVPLGGKLINDAHVSFQLRVFRPFFISVDLPYSVRRGEIVAIPVVVFNYMNKDVTADVSLENNGQFDFAEDSNDVVSGE